MNRSSPERAAHAAASIPGNPARAHVTPSLGCRVSAAVSRAGDGAAMPATSLCLCGFRDVSTGDEQSPLMPIGGTR